MFHGILRGNHQEWLGQRIGVHIYRDLAFIHCFQQRRLGLGRGAVDLVSEENVGEDRAAFELEGLLDC